MLGNVSFGGYFKKEATAWSWECCTKVLELPEDRLWISVYEDDDEAIEIWTKEVGVSPDKIVKLGKEDNFWEHGTGPCGPCSEIYFDRGESYGCGSPDCAVGCDCDRYVEFWNLVFSQFNSDGKGNYTPVSYTHLHIHRYNTLIKNKPGYFIIWVHISEKIWFIYIHIFITKFKYT